MITLSPRLQHVVDRMLLGEKPTLIASALGMSRQTVTTYQKRIYAAYDVHSQIELVAKVRKERNAELVRRLRSIGWGQLDGFTRSCSQEIALEILVTLEAP